jgi:hypothetical protein
MADETGDGRPPRRSKPAPRSKPAKATDAAKPAKLVKRSKPAKPVEPVDLVAPTEPIEAVEPLTPHEPVASPEPATPVEPVRGSRSADAVLAAVRPPAAALAWIVVVVVIALGAAGLVAAMEPGPDRPVVPGLTFDNDAAVSARLDASEQRLGELADQVDALGTQARGALAAMVSRAPDTVDAAIANGDALLVTIAERTRAIRADLSTVPYVRAADVDLHVSTEVRRHYERLVEALTATDGLDAAWDQLTVGASAAGRLAAQLAEHDRLVGVAAGQGRAAKYKTAIATLAQAADTITASRAARDRIAASVDVTVLNQWLDRNETYDKALSALYRALSSVGGKVTNKVRDAIAAEKAARAGLPPDARGLVVIMSDIGQGGLNRAVIAIEQARADLSDALAPDVDPSPAP